MTSTDSITLTHDAMAWKDQASTVLQKPVSIAAFVSSLEHQRVQLHVLRTIGQLADSTSDGGVLLNLDSSVAWIICIQTDYIGRILPIANIKNEMIAQSTSHSLSMKESSIVLPPHLSAIQWIESVTGLPQDRIGRLLGVTRQAINWWKRGGRIADDNRQRLFAVRDVLERATHLHPTQEELIAWLDTPRGADGRTPAQLLAANEINRARLLAVSSPSPRLVRPPAWVRRPIPEKFRGRSEHRQEAWSPDADNELTAYIESDEDSTNEEEGGLPLP